MCVCVCVYGGEGGGGVEGDIQFTITIDNVLYKFVCLDYNYLTKKIHTVFLCDVN